VPESETDVQPHVAEGFRSRQPARRLPLFPVAQLDESIVEPLIRQVLVPGGLFSLTFLLNRPRMAMSLKKGSRYQ
jgi:hypothetical protein